MKYIATLRLFTIPNHRIDEMFEQNRGHLIPGKEVAIAPKPFVLSGEARNALGEHPPYERLPYRRHVPTDRKKSSLSRTRLIPLSSTRLPLDGVEFIVELKDPSNPSLNTFRGTSIPNITPKNVAGWMAKST